ncbi:hypothetical protein [Halorussus rarus]|uniref:hypothetical protein n=1 Tax=Halorussus rarus TaxID=660515 RepID=UPI001F0798C9
MLTVALQIGGTDVTIEEYAEERDLNVKTVIAALSWLANHEEWMGSLIEERALRMQEMGEKDYPEGVAGPGLHEEDVADFREGAKQALADVIKDWKQYGDTRFRDSEG